MNCYGLIGHPLGHSYSRNYFTHKFSDENLDCRYLNFDIDEISKIKEIIRDNKCLLGLNITIPYKETIIPFLDSIDSEASEIGSVNTIKIEQQKLIGYNTDAAGFLACLRQALQGHNPESALILGTGGASKAVKYVLKHEQIKTYFVSRHPEKGDYTYKDLNEAIISSNLLIINTTPVGMFPHTEETPDIPFQHITTKHVIIDLIYNPEETLFLKQAANRGARTQNGLLMLHTQAEKAWQIWNNA